MRTLPYGLALVIAACGGGDNNNIDAAKTIDAPKTIDGPKPIDAPQTIDAPGSGEQLIALGSGGANALLWDPTTSTLYVTDENSDTLRTVDLTAGAVAAYDALPSESDGVSPGGMVELGDKSILIANFGFGVSGSIYHAPTGSGGTVANLTGLDPLRRRIGLAQDSAGALYSSYFTKSGNTVVGGVSSLAVTGGSAAETELAGSGTSAGFGKVVGIAATTTAVYVSDQSAKTIFKIALPGNTVSTLATGLPAADLLLMLPNGDMLTGGGSAVTRVSQSGVVSAVPDAGSGYSDVEGMAFDPAGHRLFVIDHSSTAVQDTLHVVPFMP